MDDQITISSKNVYLLIKYFDIKYKFKNIFSEYLEEKEQQKYLREERHKKLQMENPDIEDYINENIIKYEEISSLQSLNKFIKIVLIYYSSHNINSLSYIIVSNSDDSDDIKFRIINKVLNVPVNKAIQIYNLIDNIFDTLYNCLSKLFISYKKNDTTGVSFNFACFPNIDIILYLTFDQFPIQLKNMLTSTLLITPLEYNILNKCKEIIITNDKVCNINKGIHIKLEKHDSFFILLQIFNKLRQPQFILISPYYTLPLNS